MPKTQKLIWLALQKEGVAYTWQPKGYLWAKVERKGKQNVFSRQGLSAESITIEAYRPSGLNLHNALVWQGRHCFLTAIDRRSPVSTAITAALVEAVTCRLYQSIQAQDEFNRPIQTEPQLSLSFPGCLAEKYLRHSQEEPMAVVETTLILVTPKVIEMETGNLVEIQDKRYQVLLCHTLDEYKNEYELQREDEP